jgi:hypothetical protein
LRIEEWRKTPDGVVKTGSVVFEFELFVTDFYLTSLSLAGIPDTAIYSGNDLGFSCRLSGSEGDTIRLSAFTDMPGYDSIDFNAAKSVVNVSPFQVPLRLSSLARAVKDKPYKLTLSIEDLSQFSYLIKHASYVWISDKLAKPPPPSGLKKDFYFRNRIRISWNDDTDKEAGYRVERSDTYNPEFIRVAALPGNSTSFTDYNVLPGRSYFYRVTAMGTLGSSTSPVLEIPGTDRITALNPEMKAPEILVSPNPAKDILTIHFDRSGIRDYNLIVIDPMGRRCKQIRCNPDKSKNQVQINIEDLKTGMYILVIEGGGNYITRKFLKVI